MSETKEQRVIAIVEDDETVRVLLAQVMLAHGFAVREIASGAELFALLDGGEPDAVLLDLNLGDEDGLAVLERVRRHTHLPVIIVSGRQEAAARIRAFELGADDFVQKPFNAQELVLRLKRRLGDRRETAARVLRMNDLWVDPASRVARGAGGQPIPVTPAEFEILAELVRAAGRPIDREYLADIIGSRGESSTPEVITVLVHRLRRKLEAAEMAGLRIVTVPLLGYRLEGFQIE